MISGISLDIFYCISFFLEIFNINNLKFASKKIIYNASYWRSRGKMLHDKIVNSEIEYFENFLNVYDKNYFGNIRSQIYYKNMNNRQCSILDKYKDLSQAHILKVSKDIYKYKTTSAYILKESLINDIYKIIKNLNINIITKHKNSIITGQSKMESHLYKNKNYFSITKNYSDSDSLKFFDYFKELDSLFSSTKIKKMLFPDTKVLEYLKIVNNNDFMVIDDNNEYDIFKHVTCKIKEIPSDHKVSLGWISACPDIYVYSENDSYKKIIFEIKIKFVKIIIERK